jgi:hypothetical protein
MDGTRSSSDPGTLGSEVLLISSEMVDLVTVSKQVQRLTIVPGVGTTALSSITF